MDRCPKLPDKAQETCQSGPSQVPDWAREYAASFYSGSQRTVIEQRCEVIKPDCRLVMPYDCYGGQAGYQYQAPYGQDNARYYGQPGYQQRYDAYASQYWSQYQQYYWQQYQNYYWQQYYNHSSWPQGGDSRTFTYQYGCRCGCGGAACGASHGARGNWAYPQPGVSYRYESPGSYRYQERYQSQYKEQYREERSWQSSRYDGRYAGETAYAWEQNPSWPGLKQTIDSMVGRSIKEYDRRIPETLGCARFVSAALERGLGMPIYDAGVSGLEKSLKKSGWVAVPLGEAQAGDVIIGHRAPGEKGHAAIYYGDGQIANNASYKRRIAVESVDKFYKPEFKRVVAYRRQV